MSLSSRVIKDYLKNQALLKEIEQVVPNRSFKMLNISMMNDFSLKNKKTDQKFHVYKKKTEQEEDLKYVLDEKKRMDYLVSPIYRIYYNKEQKYLHFFKKLKGILKEFGVVFINKKKGIDDGYIIVLSEFMDSLAINKYSMGEYDKALGLMEKLINSEHEDFKFTCTDTNTWYDFMNIIDQIISKYDTIINMPIDKNDEPIYSIDLNVKETDPENTLNLEENFSDISSDEIKRKEKVEEKKLELMTEDDLLRFKEQEKDENLEVLNKQELTTLQQFYHLYGKALKKENENYLDNLMICFNYLMDNAKTNDEIIDLILPYLNNNFEAALFLLENRPEIVQSLADAKLKSEQEHKSRAKDTGYSQISSNVIVKVKKKQKKEKTHQQLNYDILRSLGLAEDDIFNEIATNTKKKVVENILQERQIEDDLEYMQEDFVTEDLNTLSTKYGMTRKEKGFNVVFDVAPAHKNQLYKLTERLKVVDIFPEYLQPTFTDSETLNNLQSIIHDSVYNSEENILCCAPTGAGKTNVALMSILRLVNKYYDPETKKVSQPFKIVYISPLKALAQEIVTKFQKKLEYLGVKVREFTGDMSLSKKDLAETHIIVSTPEKWDVTTRKSEALNTMLNLLIIDEIHLLDDERGRVLECLVARTVRLIESKQCRIRILGLSATLPNYKDVGRFCKVTPKGLFYFDESFRPVPLYKKFVGVKKPNIMKKPEDKDEAKKMKSGLSVLDLMNENCYEILRTNLVEKKQVLIFVHSRKETFGLANTLLNMAIAKGEVNHFITENTNPAKISRKFENRDLKQLVQKGIGCHNAGLKRKDRNSIEKSFIMGELSVVVCTATLAWGINMPCHTVIIKGTDYYEAGHGFRPISLLDVQQIFGRAGRPQYDKYGEACLITKFEDLNYFISMLSYVKPIESKFLPFIDEALLAEVVLGNISNRAEAAGFIKSTFYYIRLQKNPTLYGLKNSYDIDMHMYELLQTRLMELHNLRLIRFDEMNDVIEATELGRIASHYYINCHTMQKLCYYLKMYEEEERDRYMDIDERNLIGIVAQASEFEQISAKPEEDAELGKLKKEFNWASVDDDFNHLYKNREKKEKERGSFDQMEKVVMLFWGYLNKIDYEVYSLEADTKYIIQNAARIMRCLMEIALKQNNAVLVEKILIWLRYLEGCLNEHSTPLRMFCFDNYKRSVYAMKNTSGEINKLNYLSNQACNVIENYSRHINNGEIFSDVALLRENIHLIDDLHLGQANHNLMIRAIKAFPLIDVIYEARPIAQSIMQITLKIKPMFRYEKQWHMKREAFWVLACDGPELLHSGQIVVESESANLYPFQENEKYHHKSVVEHKFFVPLRTSANYYTVKIMSDRFVDADMYCEINLDNLKLNYEKMDYTDLLDLRPLRISALKNSDFEKLYESRIKFFNPIQTQVFFALYHTDKNILIGAPTGSGKTIIAELAMLRILGLTPHKKIVYIAPYKALVKERIKDWENRLQGLLKINVQELSGDYTPDAETLIKADVLVTTPEKWDGVSRNWQSRAYVQSVGLVIFDEIHLLGQERGPVIEVIVSRMNFMANQTGYKVRMIGLSTAIANGMDVGNWFGVEPHYLFNFRPSVRPVPVEIHFRGFSEKNYCPRMNSMNKPAFIDIKKFAGGLSTLIFVSSRRQTRLTAQEIIALTMNDFAQKSPYLKIDSDELSIILDNISDSVLRETLAFGIGMHHAGLIKDDRVIVEELFESGKIQILVATSTLAWGVNFPAKLVIIKGTEYFDPKSHGYVDMPITDILQMVGRAGRPQYNDKGYACVYVEKSKKNFYRKYLNDPFPLESAFITQIDEHLNAEVASLSITNKQQCVDYLTWTYFFKRLIRNPAFYGLDNSDSKAVQKFMIELVDSTIKRLQDSKCLEVDADDFSITPTFYGITASKYYIKPVTAKYFSEILSKSHSIIDLIKILCSVNEYNEVPVRHNEDKMNIDLSALCPFKITDKEAETPNGKTFLLFQAYFFDLPLPIRDYITDTKLVIDASFRIIAAMIDVSADYGMFKNCYYLVQLLQIIVQGIWINSSSLSNIPHFDKQIIDELLDKDLAYLFQLQLLERKEKLGETLKRLVAKKLTDNQITEICKSIARVPFVSMKTMMYKYNAETQEKDPRAGYKFIGGEEAVIEVDIARLNYKFSQNVKIKSINKTKNASWWILVGNFEDNKLYAVKKFSFDKKIKKKIILDVPNFSKDSNNIIEVFLMSDSYIGIDQVSQIDLETYETQ